MLQAKGSGAPSSGVEREADGVGAALASAIHDGAEPRLPSLTQVSAPYVARDAGGAHTGNAYMVVKGFTKSGEVVSWTGEFGYEGSLPRTFRGEASGGAWEWNDPDAATLRVNTASMQRKSSDGQAIETWAAKNKVVRITAYLYEKRIEVVDDDAKDVGGRSGVGDEAFVEAEDGKTEPEDKDGETGKGGSGGTGLDPTVESSGKDGGDGDVPTLDPDAEVEKALAEFEASLGIEAEEEGSEEGSEEGDEFGDSYESREGRDDDKGNRTQEGYSEGDIADPRAQHGEKSEWNTKEVFGGEDGMETGEGAPGDAGARHAMALFGGLLNVPASIRPLVELGLIISEGNVFGNGFGAFGKALKFATRKGAKKAEAAAIRATLATQSRKVAKAQFLEVKSALEQSDEWIKLTKAQRQQAERVMYWRFQKEFFDGVEAAAKQNAKRLKSQLKRAKKAKGKAGRAKRAAINKQLKATEEIGEAAAVKPVAGRRPINHKYAGKEFPREALPKKFREKGLKFTEDGFADFTPYAKELPNGKKSVKIELTGNRAKDEVAANAAAKLDETPPGFIWHHQQEVGEMIFVDQTLHEAARHTGGGALWTENTGIPYE